MYLSRSFTEDIGLSYDRISSVLLPNDSKKAYCKSEVEAKKFSDTTNIYNRIQKDFLGES